MHGLSQLFIKTCPSNHVFAERDRWHLVRVERKVHRAAQKHENEGYAGRRRRWLDADCEEPMIYKVTGNKSSAASARSRLGSWYFAIGASSRRYCRGDVIRHGSRRDFARSTVVWVINPRVDFETMRRCGDPRPTETRSRYPFPVAIRISERPWKIFANTVIFAALGSVVVRIWVSILNFSSRRSRAIYNKIFANMNILLTLACKSQED